MEEEVIKYDFFIVSKIILDVDVNFVFYNSDLRTIFNQDGFQNFNFTKTILNNNEYYNIANEFFNSILALSFEKYIRIPETINNKFVYLIIQIVITLNEIVGPYLKTLKFLSNNNIFETNTTHIIKGTDVGYAQPDNQIESPGYINDKTIKNIEDKYTNQNFNISNYKQYLNLKLEIIDQINKKLFYDSPSYVKDGYF